MNRIFNSSLFSRSLYLLICCVLGIMFQMTTLAQSTTAITIPIDTNSCIRDPETGQCISISLPIAKGTANAQPTSTDGVVTNITASISAFDMGFGLAVTGTANGLDPTKVYVSLFYDTGSVPTGPCACLPTNPPP